MVECGMYEGEGHLKLKHSSEEPILNTKPTQQSLMRAVALFLDGMSRALILSFGPSLVYRLVYGGTLKLGLDCAKVAFPLAIVAAAYLFGKALGTSMATKTSFRREKLPRTVARYSGAAFSLLVFTFGAGLQSVWWLVLIRFFSGVIVGVICVATHHSKRKATTQSAIHLGFKDMIDLENGGVSEIAADQRHGSVGFVSGATKLYMTAFAVSILAGGLLYRHATEDPTFRALTDSRQSTLSPLFLLAVSLIGESVLRCVFSCFESERYEEEITIAERAIPGGNSPLLSLDTMQNLSPTKGRNQAESNTLETFAACRDRLDSANSAAITVPGRERLGTSDSEFFDCRSVLSGFEEQRFFDDIEAGGYRAEDLDNDMARYVDRQCLDGFGAPSFAPVGDSPNNVPENYLILCGKNRKKAETMWKKTQEWRRQHKVWRIHTIPNRWFRDIKMAYPHFLHGFSKNGFAVMYEQPGKMNLKRLFREGCSVSDMLRHYMFLMEFISNHICTTEAVRARMYGRSLPHSSSTWGILVVMDVKGAGLSHLSGDVLTYLKGAGDINNSHYPLSLKRAFLINSPFWLAGAWKSVKGVLPESVHVDILSSHQYLYSLRDYIDDDQIPIEYGGSSPHKLGDHPFEKSLYDLVDEAAAGEGIDLDIPSEEEFECGSFDRESIRIEPMVESEEAGTGMGLSSLERFDSQKQGSSARRRRAEHEGASDLGTSFKNEDNKDNKKHAYGTSSADNTDRAWYIASFVYFAWSAIQGHIETAIPLWILTPPEFGGLGYAPSRSGVAMFSSAMVLLWIMRTKVSNVLSKIPSKAPLRSYRIGVGAQSVLLLLLATVPRTVQPDQRSDAVFVMAITIILMACIVLSSILGRSSSSILHRTVSASMALDESKPKGWFARRYGVDCLLRDCNSGRFTHQLTLVAEIFGVILIAPVSCLSLRIDQVAPFDGTFSLIICSLFTFGLYAFSFTLITNSVGTSVSPATHGSSVICARKCGTFLCDLATVSASDVASLFDEANWSLSPLLGHRQESWEP